MSRRRPCTSHAQPLAERQTETSEGLSAAVSISVTSTGADEATICRENSPEEDRAADPAAAAADVMEALSEGEARAGGVPSIEDLLSPPIALPRILVLRPDPAAGVRGVENMSYKKTLFIR